MPKRAQYTVCWSPERGEYLITGSQLAAPDHLTLAWLETHRAFAFHGHNGQINLLKERRRRGSEGYWYAYRRHRGKIHKRYIGRDEQVSSEKLEEIAALLEQEKLEVATPRPSTGRFQTRQNASELAEVAHQSGSLEQDLSAGISQVESGSSGKALFVEPLLLAKLQLPRLQKNLLARDNLLNLLDQSLERKATLLSGPAGYGKTTLIAQWIATRSEHADFPSVAGVTLDESDNDPCRFWRYVIAACQKFAPSLGEEALSLLFASRFLAFQRKPLERMLIALLNELGQLEHAGVLILDDLHVISSPQVGESLSFFLEHLPAALHLILLMRGDPPFSSVRLRARNELLDISPAYLRFSLEETRLFWARELSFALSPRSTRQLHERLEGWPAGFRLFSQVLARVQNEQEIAQVLASFAGNHWSLREYFLSEVFAALPADQQEFLLQTSILPRVNSALCQALTGREDSARLVEALRSGDFFLIPLDGVGEWLRYHSLFAEAMQQEARKRLGDARLNRLAVQASIWYEQHGLLSEAIETALNAADFARVANLVAYFIESKRQNGVFVFLELYKLKRWLEGLPEEVLKRNPDFCLHYAMILLFALAEEEPRMLSGRERVYRLLGVAEQQWRDANDTAKLAEVFAFRALLARQEGRVLQALTWARQALAWLLKDDLVWRTIALTVVGMGEVLTGTLDQAREFFLEAQALNEQLENATYGRATRGMLAWVHLEQGELRRAAEQFRQMQAEARAQEDQDDIARTQLGLSLLLYEWNKLEEAEEAAREAYLLGEQMSEEEFLCTATIRLARIEQARDQSEQAQQRLTAWLARGLAPVSPLSYQFYRDIQATLAQIQLASGDLAAVQRWSAGLEQRAEILPLYQRQREQLLLSRLFVAQGEYPQAIEQLEPLAVHARRTGHLVFGLRVQAVLALAYSQIGERSQAYKLLSEVLAAAWSEGYLRLFLDEGKPMAALLRELLPLLHEKPLAIYTRTILAAFTRETAPESAGIPGLLDPLSPQERKVLRLLVLGHSNAEIAGELVVSINTVRTQVRSIYRKLDVNNRVQASAVARQMNLL